MSCAAEQHKHRLLFSVRRLVFMVFRIVCAVNCKCFRWLS